MKNFVLYKLYDTDGILLYVGITNNLPARLKQHEKSSQWYKQVHTISAKQYPSRETLLIAEKQTIVNDKPIYNIIHCSYDARLKRQVTRYIDNLGRPKNFVRQVWVED